MRLKNQEIIEHHIEHAHQDADDTGRAHVARALEHRTRQAVELIKRSRQGEDEKIEGGITGDVGPTTQPIGQGMGDGHRHGHREQTEQEGDDKRMAEHLPGFLEVVGTNEMRHLHGETH